MPLQDRKRPQVVWQEAPPVETVRSRLWIISTVGGCIIGSGAAYVLLVQGASGLNAQRSSRALKQGAREDTPSGPSHAPDSRPATSEVHLAKFCARAANASSRICSDCSWWEPTSLIPQPARAAAAMQQKPEMAWFFCLTRPPGNFTKLKFIDYTRATALSGRLNSPNLAPYAIYLHAPEQSLDDDEFTRFLTAIGVRVVMHRLSFLATVRSRTPMMPPKKLGSYCKLDVAQLVGGSLNAELRSRDLPTDRVLVTDTDVLVAGTVRFDAAQPLRTWAAADEGFGSKLTANTGVMLVNVSFFNDDFKYLLDYGAGNRFHFAIHDQTWLNAYTTKNNPKGLESRLNASGAGPFDEATAAAPGLRWHMLDRAVYNGRPYEHPARNRTAPIIWHWQGYKVDDYTCWERAMARNAFPWGQTGGRHGHAILASVTGCQPVGGMIINAYTLGPCAMRTYAWLYGQQQRMLALARQIGSAVEEAPPGTTQGVAKVALHQHVRTFLQMEKEGAHRSE